MFVVGKCVFVEHYLRGVLKEILDGRESDRVKEGFVAYVWRG